MLDGAIEPFLTLVSPLPEATYVMKICKTCFANWLLQLYDELGCLSIFYTLRAENIQYKNSEK